MVQLSGKCCCNVQGTCVYSSLLESAIQAKRRFNTWIGFVPNFQILSTFCMSNPWMSWWPWRKKTCSLGLDMFSSLFPHLFVSNPASKSPAEGRLFTSFLGGQFREKSKKFDREFLLLLPPKQQKSPHEKTRVTGNEHVANVPLIFGKWVFVDDLASNSLWKKDSKFQHRQLEASLFHQELN